MPLMLMANLKALANPHTYPVPSRTHARTGDISTQIDTLAHSPGIVSRMGIPRAPELERLARVERVLT